jgi:hypothetical protein
MSKAESDKAYKVAAHRAERRNASAVLAARADQDDRRLHAKAYGDPWLSKKDGKQYVPGSPRAMRK